MVLGILSLIIWALLFVVTAKYVLILLRADNKGEGGTLALMALASRSLVRGGSVVVLLGVISGALFYGDAIITPALSVLSAIEGIKVVTPAFDAYVVPLTVLVLVILFAVQSRGTATCRVVLWTGHIVLVCHDCSRGHLACWTKPVRAARIQPVVRRKFPASSTVSSGFTRLAPFSSS